MAHPAFVSLVSFSLLFAIFLVAGEQSLLAQCNNTTVLSITGPGSSTWTAPATGGPFSIRITATGASGGDVTDFPGLAGSGATMSGTFTVQNGQTIRAIAGGAGESAPNVGPGGGGGSGAVDCGTSGPGGCSTGSILIIAAGGNGDNGPGDPGLGGLISQGSGDGGAGGGSDGGGGGGGENGNGGDSNNGNPGTGGGFGGAQVSLTGISVSGAGSTSGGGDGGAGMGAGGGGGNNGSGGGGGHTGGAGDNASAAQSFNSGTDPANTDGAEGGGFNSGTVVIVCLQALPIELINFKAMIQSEQDVMLLWSTASEKDNEGFEVERSLDNRNWSSLGFVRGMGTTTEKHEYTFHDERPLSGVNYYRLKQMDTDGRFQYTPMVVADLHGKSSQFDIFPNPSSEGAVSVRAVSMQEGDATLEIFTWTGLRAYRETFRAYEGTIVWPLDLSTFPKGTYTARLEMPDGTIQFRKIVLQ